MRKALIKRPMQYRLDRRFVPLIIAHAYEFKFYYLGAVLCLVLLHHFQSMIPFLAKELGDLAGSGRLEEIELWKFFALAAVVLLFRTFSRLLFFYPARVQQKTLRHEIMYRLEHTHPSNYRALTEGDVFQTIYNDFNRLRGLVGFGLLQVGNIIIAAIIFIPKIREFNPDFLIAFLPLVGCMVFFMVTIIFFQPLMKKNMDLMAEVQNFIIESYSAKATVKNFHSEKSIYELFRHHSAKELKIFFISSLGRTFGMPIVRLGVGASLLWAAYIVKVQDLPGTALIFFSGFLFLVQEPLMFMSWIGVVASQGYAGWQRIQSLVQMIKKPADLDWARYQHYTKPQLKFWDQEISFELKPNQWNVLVGETGSGKSYLLGKIADILVVSEKSFSFISQEPYLYNDNVKNNIFLGNEITPEKEAMAKKLICQFGLDVLAPTLNEVLKLEVGENGKKVSGGQAKRICLIRSLLSDVDIIVWDDPFSSVDFILEKQIVSSLKYDPQFQHKTFILSSHRLSSVKFCDWLVYVDKTNGVVEQGEVKELFAKESFTSAHFQKQLV